MDMYQVGFVALQVLVLQLVVMPRLALLGYRLVRLRNREWVAANDGEVARFVPRTALANRILGACLLGALVVGAYVSSEPWINTVKWCSIGAFVIESIYHGLRFQRLKGRIPPPAQRGAKLIRRRLRDRIPVSVRWAWGILAAGGLAAWVAAYLQDLVSPSAVPFAIVGVIVMATTFLVEATRTRTSFDRRSDELSGKLFAEVVWAFELVFTALWSTWAVLALSENLAVVGAQVDVAFAFALLATLVWFVYSPTARKLMHSNAFARSP